VDPAIFLDRDGVLNENRADYVRNWSQVKIIPDAVRALRFPALQDYKIVIVTNQSAVGRGLISLETAQEINSRLVERLRAEGGRVDAVYMCPHAPSDDCLCRKPKPGLLLQAATELSLDLPRSWMIGDAWSDLQAGQLAGVRHSILVRTGRGTEMTRTLQAQKGNYLTFDSLSQALLAIFSIDQSRTEEAS
jgi:D-glycero-D-manno-heptose 1,7-bisphosphate phosphatase